MKPLRTILTITAIVSTLNLSTHAAPPAPQNSGTVDVKTGQTSISISSNFLTGLQVAQVEIAKVIPGKVILSKGELRFPIAGGAIDLTTLRSEVIHSGGVNFSSETDSVTAQDFILTIPPVGSSEAPVISAIVVVNGLSGGRFPLFNVDLALTAPLVLPKNKKIVVEDADLTLTLEGVVALNTAFGVSIFNSATVVGSATVSATVVKGSL